MAKERGISGEVAEVSKQCSGGGVSDSRMIDVAPHIKALACLKRSEEYERMGEYDKAYSEASDAREYIKQWQESIFTAKGLIR